MSGPHKYYEQTHEEVMNSCDRVGPSFPQVVLETGKQKLIRIFKLAHKENGDQNFWVWEREFYVLLSFVPLFFVLSLVVVVIIIIHVNQRQQTRRPVKIESKTLEDCKLLCMRGHDLQSARVMGCGSDSICVCKHDGCMSRSQVACIGGLPDPN